MVFTSLSGLACSTSLDINLAKNLCSMEIELISLMNKSSKDTDAIFLLKGIGARMGTMQRAMSSSANSYSVSLTIFASSAISGKHLMGISECC